MKSHVSFQVNEMSKDVCFYSGARFRVLVFHGSCVQDEVIQDGEVLLTWGGGMGPQLRRSFEWHKITVDLSLWRV